MSCNFSHPGIFEQRLGTGLLFEDIVARIGGHCFTDGLNVTPFPFEGDRGYEKIYRVRLNSGYCIFNPSAFDGTFNPSFTVDKTPSDIFPVRSGGYCSLIPPDIP